MNLPDPKDYTDGVQFFFDVHKVVLHNCAELSKLLNDAEAHGVFQSFATHPEWESLFHFFTVDAGRHERDEDELLFPAITSRVPHMGFQQPDSPIRFLIEGHGILSQKVNLLIHDWGVFRSREYDASSLGATHATHAAEDAQFIANGRELVRMYREHVTLENERVYSVAERVLSGSEKLELADRLRDIYSQEAVTTLYNFDEPQFSNPEFNVQVIPTEAIGEEEVPSEEEESEDEEGDTLP